jgi:hypothetical protein
MCVFTHCENNNIPNLFVKEKGMAGCAGVLDFLHYNPVTASRKVQNLNPGGAQNLNCFVVNDYFAKLKITMEELGVMNKPECIYSVNEKGCSLCLYKQYQLYTWLKEMLTGNISSTPWHIFPSGVLIIWPGANF